MHKVLIGVAYTIFFVGLNAYMLFEPIGLIDLIIIEVVGVVLGWALLVACDTFEL